MADFIEDSPHLIPMYQGIKQEFCKHGAEYFKICCYWEMDVGTVDPL